MTLDALAYLVVAFGMSVLLTRSVERVALRVGIVARPTADRWHRTAVPLLGGLAIAVATVIPTLAIPGIDRRMGVLLAGALAMAGVGLVDDLRSLKPQAKLVVQIILAVTLLNFGFVLPLTRSPFVNVFITIFWIVGITNAFNLLDNMDGLSATIALFATGFRTLFFAWDGDEVGLRLALVFMGALAGFLVRNFPPAKIFMGDAGSLFIGSLLAGLSLLDVGHVYSRGVAAVLVIPVLLLMIPIFDTAFVTITRLLAGRSLALGGRDHTSHRLVAIGLSERQVLLLLAAISAASGVLAALSYGIGVSQTVALLSIFVLGLVLLGIHLNRVTVVHTGQPVTERTVLRLLANFQYKRQIATLTVDVCLIGIAYYAAYLLRFEETFLNYSDLLFRSLPIVMLIQIATLAGFGLYRGVWRYTGLRDVLQIVKAVTAGTMVTTVVLLYSDRFLGFSRTVFLLDWMILIILIVGSRASFRLLGEILHRESASSLPVLIYGAGDGGVMLVRELLNNPALARTPIGFIDDDRSKHRSVIHGLPVFGAAEQIESLVRDRHVAEIIVSSEKILGNGYETASGICHALEVPIRRASIQIE